MKRILSVVLACALLVGCVMIFASCGVSGTYEKSILGVSTTYKFSGSKVSVVNEALGDFETVCSYKIEKDDDGNETLVLTVKEYNYEGDSNTVAGIVADLNEELEASEDGIVTKHSFEKGDGFIKIDGVKYEKK